MPTFERIYSDLQRDAVTSAYLDRGIRPQRRIAELAKHGELVHDGQRLEPFDLNVYTLRDMLVKERKRRAGRVRGEAAKLSHEDAIDALRVRLINVADTTLAIEERRAAAQRDPERLRQIARCVREVAALPRKGENRSIAPGQTHDREQTEGATRGGIGGQLLAAARSQPKTAPDVQPTETQSENAERSAAQSEDERTNAGEAETPGDQESRAQTSDLPSVHWDTHTRMGTLR